MGSFGFRAFLVLLWMSVIFALSGQQGSDSAGLSGWISFFLANAALQLASFLGFSMDSFTAADWGNLIHPLVRKIAHASEYAVLSLLLAYCLVLRIRGKVRVAVAAFAIACLYAVADEIHQLLVPGRAGQMRDVFIDGLGALLGSSLYILVSHRSDSKKLTV